MQQRKVLGRHTECFVEHRSVNLCRIAIADRQNPRQSLKGSNCRVIIHAPDTRSRWVSEGAGMLVIDLVNGR